MGTFIKSYICEQKISGKSTFGLVYENYILLCQNSFCEILIQKTKVTKGFELNFEVVKTVAVLALSATIKLVEFQVYESLHNNTSS
jgi:hypothetical protein